MGVFVVTGASVACPFGTMPANLNVTSQATVLMDGKPVASVQDSAPNINITSCGMCSSMANPQVAAATAAALGVLTPQPCIPATAGSWIAVQTAVLAEGKPCLANDSKIMCSYGGVITIVNPGQAKNIIA